MVAQNSILDVQQAHMRGFKAEQHGQWHLVVQHYLFCLEQASSAQDKRAVRFFAKKLSLVYNHMRMQAKAEYYQRLSHV